MNSKKFLYTIKKDELKKATFVDIESITILNFRQIVEHQVVPGQSLVYFQQPNVGAYPLLVNTNLATSKHRVPQVDCMNVMEKFVIERDIYNTKSCGKPNKRLKVITRRHVLLRILTAPIYVSEIPVIVMRYKHVIYMSLLKNDCPITPLGKQHNVFARYCETTTNTPTCGSFHQNNKGFFMYGAKFGKLDIFYSAEACSVVSDKPVKDLGNMDVLNSCCFISVNIMPEEKIPYWDKTSTVFKWWCKGYLSNVKSFFVGFVNANGVINQPALLKDIIYLEEQQHQRIQVSKAFLDKFINLVVDTTKNYDSLDTILKYHFDKQGNIGYSVHNANEFSMFSADFAAYLRKQ